MKRQSVSPKLSEAEKEAVFVEMCKKKRVSNLVVILVSLLFGLVLAAIIYFVMSSGVKDARVENNKLLMQEAQRNVQGIFDARDKSHRTSIPNPLRPPSKPQDLVIGKWTWTGPFEGKVITIINEFTKDGVVKIVQGRISFEAKYRFVDDNHIEYEVARNKQTSEIESITKDKLVAINEQGLKREWTRP
jgi:uncharacterized membrane protein